MVKAPYISLHFLAHTEILYHPYTAEPALNQRPLQDEGSLVQGLWDLRQD